MNVTFTGKIIAAGQVQSGTSQNGTQWSSCEYVIEELNQQYPARAVIQVYGSDKLLQFNIQVGEIITAHIGLKAHQSKDGRWFNQLDCWKVQRPTAKPQQMQQQGQVYASQVGQNYQQGAQQGFQQMQNFPPQVDANGHPIQQQAQYGVQQGNLPFPANN